LSIKILKLNLKLEKH